MKERKILKLNGELKKFNLTNGLNHRLHQHLKIDKGKAEPIRFIFRKEFKEFLDKYSLEPTIFNLNCLEELGGVVLTDLQVKELNNRAEAV